MNSKFIPTQAPSEIHHNAIMCTTKHKNEILIVIDFLIIFLFLMNCKRLAAINSIEHILLCACDMHKVGDVLGSINHIIFLLTTINSVFFLAVENMSHGQFQLICMPSSDCGSGIGSYAEWSNLTA